MKSLSYFVLLLKAVKVKQRRNPTNEERRVNRKEPVRSLRVPPNVVPKNCPMP
jgi:hypothetical protein